MKWDLRCRPDISTLSSVDVERKTSCWTKRNIRTTWRSWDTRSRRMDSWQTHKKSRLSKATQSHRVLRSIAASWAWWITCHDTCHTSQRPFTLSKTCSVRMFHGTLILDSEKNDQQQTHTCHAHFTHTSRPLHPHPTPHAHFTHTSRPLHPHLTPTSPTPHAHFTHTSRPLHPHPTPTSPPSHAHFTHTPTSTSLTPHAYFTHTSRPLHPHPTPMHWERPSVSCRLHSSSASWRLGRPRWYTKPQTVTETPSRCSPKMTVLTLSLATDRTLTEPCTTKSGRMVKQMTRVGH